MSAVPVKSALLVAGGLLIGATLSIESTVNGFLGGGLGPVGSATFSNFLSLFIVMLVAPWVPGLRVAFRRLWVAARSREVRLWHFFGGAAGGAMVVTQAATVGQIGTAVFILGIVAGQTVGGLVIDRLGIGPGARRPVTSRRLFGAGLTIAAVIPAAVVQGIGAQSMLAAFPLLAGIGLAWQLGVNGKLDRVGEHSYPAVLVSFAMGATLLGIVLSATLLIRAGGLEWPSNPAYYSGGIFGAIFVLGTVLLVRSLGVFAAGISLIAGQLIGSVAIDTALARGGGQPAVVACSIALLLTGVVVVMSESPLGRGLSAGGEPKDRDTRSAAPVS